MHEAHSMLNINREVWPHSRWIDVSEPKNSRFGYERMCAIHGMMSVLTRSVCIVRATDACMILYGRKNGTGSCNIKYTIYMCYTLYVISAWKLDERGFMCVGRFDVWPVCVLRLFAVWSATEPEAEKSESGDFSRCILGSSHCFVVRISTILEMKLQ